MKWDVRDNDPPIACSTGAILLDGKPVRHVTAFDEEAGWVRVLCTGEVPGHPDRRHVDPMDDTEVCRVVRRGRVEYRA